MSTINQALEGREHEVLPDVLFVIGDENAEAFMAKSPAERNSWLIPLISPRTNPDARIVELNQVAVVRDNLVAALSAAGITGTAQQVEVIDTPHQSATPNKYWEVIIGNITPEEAVTTRGISFYPNVTSAVRLADLMQSGALIALGIHRLIWEEGEKDNDGMFGRIQSLRMPQDLADDLYLWSQDALFDPITKSNRWFRLSEAQRAFRVLETLYGERWTEILRLLSEAAGMVDVQALFNGTGTINLSDFKGLGNLKNTFPLIAAKVSRNVTPQLLAQARTISPMFGPLFKALRRQEVHDRYTNETIAAREQEFLWDVARIEPNWFALATIIRGLSLGMSMVNPQMGNVNNDLNNAIGQAGLLYVALFGEVMSSFKVKNSGNDFSLSMIFDLIERELSGKGRIEPLPPLQTVAPQPMQEDGGWVIPDNPVIQLTMPPLLAPRRQLFANYMRLREEYEGGREGAEADVKKIVTDLTAVDEAIEKMRASANITRQPIRPNPNRLRNILNLNDLMSGKMSLEMDRDSLQHKFDAAPTQRLADELDRVLQAITEHDLRIGQLEREAQDSQLQKRPSGGVVRIVGRVASTGSGDAEEEAKAWCKRRMSEPSSIRLSNDGGVVAGSYVTIQQNNGDTIAFGEGGLITQNNGHCTFYISPDGSRPEVNRNNTAPTVTQVDTWVEMKRLMEQNRL